MCCWFAALNLPLKSQNHIDLEHETAARPDHQAEGPPGRSGWRSPRLRASRCWWRW